MAECETTPALTTPLRGAATEVLNERAISDRLQAERKGESISTESLIGALTGPVGAIVVLAIAVFSLATTRYVVPAPVFKASEERNFLLAAENESLQQISLKQNDQLTEQKVHNARLQEQVNYLTQRIETLTAEIEGLRKQVQDSL